MQEEWGHAVAAEALPAEEGVVMAEVLGLEEGDNMREMIVGEIVDERPTQDLPPGPSPLGYIVNRWKTHDGEHRAGRMLGFQGRNACLEATWGPGGHKPGEVPWELFPADEWNPNTGQCVARGTWNPLCGNHGTSGTFAHQGGGKLYYIVNRWKAQNGEHRAGRMLGFTGENAVLEGTWGRPGGRDKVPWELFSADEWSPMGSRVDRGSFNPLQGGNGRSCSPGAFSHRLGDLPVVIPPATECCTLM